MSGFKLGGTTCSVASCRCNAMKMKAVGEHVSFHRFPRDPHLRNEWIRLCYRSDVFNPENNRICSKHFYEEDFEDLCRARIMNVPPKKLKSTAIPCLNLPSVEVNETTLTTNNNSATGKEQEVINELPELNDEVHPLEVSDAYEDAHYDFIQNEIEVEFRDDNSSDDLCQNKKSFCKNIQAQNEYLTRENERLKRELEKIKQDFTLG